MSLEDTIYDPETHPRHCEALESNNIDKCDCGIIARAWEETLETFIPPPEEEEAPAVVDNDWRLEGQDWKARYRLLYAEAHPAPPKVALRERFSDWLISHLIGLKKG